MIYDAFIPLSRFGFPICDWSELLKFRRRGNVLGQRFAYESAANDLISAINKWQP